MDKDLMAGHFNTGRLIKFILPSVFMMLVTSVYSIVDGLFLSNFAGKNAFAAVNLVMPMIMIISSFGFMIGSGGSALVSYYLGAKEKKKANEIFSMLITLQLIIGCIVSAIVFILAPQIVDLLGASDAIRDDCILYGRMSLCSMPAFMLMNSFQTFLMTAGKGKIGLTVSITCGCINVVLDFVLVYLFNLGVMGAAAATMTSEYIGALIPSLIFFFSKTSAIHFTRFRFVWKHIGKACSNGISEMLTNVSGSIVSMIYNLQLIKLAGEDGIAAYGVIMYVTFIFIAVFIGYSMGINPLVGYKYGADDKKELNGVLKRSLIIMLIAGGVMFAIAQLLSPFISKCFVGYDKVLYEMTVRAFRIFSMSYVICGINIFMSAFFTGLNNGPISAVISFSRTFIIQLTCVIVLPIILGITGIWLSLPIAEATTLFISFGMLFNFRKRYGYM